MAWNGHRKVNVRLKVKRRFKYELDKRRVKEMSRRSGVGLIGIGAMIILGGHLSIVGMGERGIWGIISIVKKD